MTKTRSAPTHDRTDDSHGRVVGRSVAGCLAFCAGCKHFTLEFGPMCLELSSGEVSQLQCHLAELLHQHAPEVDGFRRFDIRLDDSRAGLRLYSDEAFELHHLLEQGAGYLDEAAEPAPPAVH